MYPYYEVVPTIVDENLDVHSFLADKDAQAFARDYAYEMSYALYGIPADNPDADVIEGEHIADCATKEDVIHLVKFVFGKDIGKDWNGDHTTFDSPLKALALAVATEMRDTCQRQVSKGRSIDNINVKPVADAALRSYLEPKEIEAPKPKAGKRKDVSMELGL